MPHLLRRRLSLVMLSWLVLWGGTSWAQESRREINVLGVGATSDFPNHALVKGVFEGSADTTADAARKHAKLKAELAKKFVADQHPGLTLHFQGELLSHVSGTSNNGDPFGGGGGGDTDGKFIVREVVIFRLEIADQEERDQILKRLAEVVDSAVEAGVSFSQSRGSFGYSASVGRMVLFGVKDPGELNRMAYEAALEDARAQAEPLAKLIGAGLGRVLSVQTLHDSNEDVNADPFALGNELRRPPQHVSAQNRPIRVRRSVRVVFELVD